VIVSVHGFVFLISTWLNRQLFHVLHQADSDFLTSNSHQFRSTCLTALLGVGKMEPLNIESRSSSHIGDVAQQKHHWTNNS
jgi:hypothetical protein